MSSYQLYRNTTLGTTLQDSLDELLQTQQISPSIKNKVLEQVFFLKFHFFSVKPERQKNFEGQIFNLRFF